MQNPGRAYQVEQPVGVGVAVNIKVTVKECFIFSNFLQNVLIIIMSLRMNLCSYTEGRATNMIKYGKCSASCWKDFFLMSPYKNSQICYGDEGTSLMAKERGRCVKS